MRFNDLLVYSPGNQFPKPTDVAPFVAVPVWWRHFVFEVLKGTPMSVYLYIVTYVDQVHSVAYPSIKQIQKDLGLRSDSQVYEALRKLVDYGFLLRRRSALPNRTLRTHRNIYQRPAPEYTLLRLLEAGKIDEYLLHTASTQDRRDDEPKGNRPFPKDTAKGLRRLLGDNIFEELMAAPNDQRRELLTFLLESKLAERTEESRSRYSDRQPAPRDRARLEASDRERSIAASGGVAPAPAAVGFDAYNLDDEIPF